MQDLDTLYNHDNESDLIMNLKHKCKDFDG